MPNAEFWRLWGCALALGLLAYVMFHGLGRAETGRVSFYDARTRGMTAAHRSLPLGSHVRVCFRRCVVVTINDRGPFIRGRVLDLSRHAARAVGLEPAGVATMTLDRLD